MQSGVDLTLCNLNPTVQQCSLDLMFGPKDFPITLTCCLAGVIHVTGHIFDLQNKGDLVNSTSIPSGEIDHVSEEKSEPIVIKKSSKRALSATSNESISVIGLDTDHTAELGDNNAKKKFKQPSQCASITNTTEVSQNKEIISEPTVEEKKQEDLPKTPENRKRGIKRWRVKPQDGEGILLPSPKPIAKASGLCVTDHIIGKGEEPLPGKRIKVIYEGFLDDGRMFDSNIKRKKPFIFRKGTGEVIRGLDLGIDGMKVGGAREIVIPPQLGYDEQGLGEAIPPGATLIFRLTLLGVV
eukprot:CAMPEP_0182429662 /NCGR_PEP_ID=MMETSP1167-20130531/32182_1 /TAXON_ID=2988 /ORGANISM="Mallomonas Sp, Strain CCMP3275" /LENGTH=296 /DNA_ID=CAMNT_0024613687 /DNA_START=282 /DNA_END=1172 /DNA_ORIENTATION=+